MSDSAPHTHKADSLIERVTADAAAEFCLPAEAALATLYPCQLVRLTDTEHCGRRFRDCPGLRRAP